MLSIFDQCFARIPKLRSDADSTVLTTGILDHPMALNATVHRCTLQVSDLDRAYYQTHQLTIARHPSETDERMMVRLLAFALNADDRLSFTRGLSQDDEPEI